VNGAGGLTFCVSHFRFQTKSKPVPKTPQTHTQKEGFTYIYIYIYRERERERERERGCYSRRGHSRDFEIVVFEGAEEKGVDGRGGGG
jgi:hypothetical protein